MGNKLGGKRSHRTLKQKLGPVGYAEHMATIGARGGKAQVPKGLSYTRNTPEYAEARYYRPKPQYVWGEE